MNHYIPPISLAGRRQYAIARNLTWFLSGFFVGAGIIILFAAQEVERIKQQNLTTEVSK